MSQSIKWRKGHTEGMGLDDGAYWEALAQQRKEKRRVAQSMGMDRKPTPAEKSVVKSSVPDLTLDQLTPQGLETPNWVKQITKGDKRKMVNEMNRLKVKQRIHDDLYGATGLHSQSFKKP